MKSNLLVIISFFIIIEGVMVALIAGKDLNPFFYFPQELEDPIYSFHSNDSISATFETRQYSNRLQSRIIKTLKLNNSHKTFILLNGSMSKNISLDTKNDLWQLQTGYEFTPVPSACLSITAQQKSIFSTFNNNFREKDSYRLADTLRQGCISYYQNWNKYLSHAALLSYNSFRRNQFIYDNIQSVYPSGLIAQVLSRTALPFFFSDSLRNYLHFHQDYTNNGISRLGFTTSGIHDFNNKKHSIEFIASFYQNQIKITDPQVDNLYKETNLNGFSGIKFNTRMFSPKISTDLIYVFGMDFVKSPSNPVDQDVKNSNHNFEFITEYNSKPLSYRIDLGYRNNFKDHAFREHGDTSSYLKLVNNLDEDQSQIDFNHRLILELKNGIKLSFIHGDLKIMYDYPYLLDQNITDKNKTRDDILSSDSILLSLPFLNLFNIFASRNNNQLSYLKSSYSHLNDSTSRYIFGQVLTKNWHGKLWVKEIFALSTYYEDYQFLDRTDTISGYAQRVADLRCSTAVQLPYSTDIHLNTYYSILDKGYSYKDNDIRKYGVTQVQSRPALEIGVSRKLWYTINFIPKFMWQSIRYWNYKPYDLKIPLSWKDRRWKYLFGVSPNYYNTVNLNKIDIGCGLNSYSESVSFDLDLTRRIESQISRVHSNNLKNVTQYWVGFVSVGILF
ncbi:MAG: hypothetical protein ABIA63_06755 [bacterium]